MTRDTMASLLDSLLDLQTLPSLPQPLDRVQEALRNIEGPDLDRFFACLWLAPLPNQARKSVALILQNHLNDTDLSCPSLNTETCTPQDLDTWVSNAYSNLVDTDTIRTLACTLLEAASKIDRSLLHSLLSITAPGYDDEEHPVQVELELWRLVTARGMARRAKRVRIRMDRLDGIACAEWGKDKDKAPARAGEEQRKKNCEGREEE